MLRIVHIPNPVLSTLSQPIEVVDNKIKQLVKDMEEALSVQHDPEGVGLAAVQVGINLQLFIIKPNPADKTEVFINPKIIELITKKTGKKTTKKEKRQLEGCLSVPRIWSPIVRPHKVFLEYVDLDGTKKQQWFSGFKATIIQHEVDHLQGILFTQRALESHTPLYEEQEDELKRMDIK